VSSIKAMIDRAYRRGLRQGWSEPGLLVVQVGTMGWAILEEGHLNWTFRGERWNLWVNDRLGMARGFADHPEVAGALLEGRPGHYPVVAISWVVGGDQDSVQLRWVEEPSFRQPCHVCGRRPDPRWSEHDQGQPEGLGLPGPAVNAVRKSFRLACSTPRRSGACRATGRCTSSGTPGECCRRRPAYSWPSSMRIPSRPPRHKPCLCRCRRVSPNPSQSL
jgi:hypothetical protein